MPAFEMSSVLHYFHGIGYLDLTPAGIKGYLAMLISHLLHLFLCENYLFVPRVICEFFEIIENKVIR